MARRFLDVTTQFTVEDNTELELAGFYLSDQTTQADQSRNLFTRFLKKLGGVTQEEIEIRASEAELSSLLTVTNAQLQSILTNISPNNFGELLEYLTLRMYTDSGRLTGTITER